MGRKSPELRVAVGTPAGLRSTVWKFAVQRSEIYIFTRMFGSDAKVSLHSTGDFQWSATSTWVLAQPGRKNSDRHIVRWNVELPEGRQALHAFRICIPHSELRQIPGEDTSGVQWLPSPGPGQAITLECYITPPLDSAPSIPSERKPLLSWQLENSRWFVVLINAGAMDRDYTAEREAMIRQAEAAGVTVEPHHRIAAFGGTRAETRFLIEMVPKD
jgi:hypothetical protein